MRYSFVRRLTSVGGAVMGRADVSGRKARCSASGRRVQTLVGIVDFLMVMLFRLYWKMDDGVRALWRVNYMYECVRVIKWRVINPLIS